MIKGCKKYSILTFYLALFLLLFGMNINVNAAANDNYAIAENVTIDGFYNSYADVFDPDFYQNAYADVKTAFGNNPDMLLQHFLKCGVNEGRQGSADFDPVTYMNRYPDLQAVYGSNMKMYYLHYIQVGKKEGRSGRPDASIISDSKEQVAVAPVTVNNYENAHDIMMSFKNSYPEGTRYTNDDFYAWNGGIYYGGFGCAGFAFMISDAIFGDNQAELHCDLSKIRVGDILRINNDSHSVIVLEVNKDGVVVTEGNYGGKVHWGRKFSYQKLANVLDYVMTRY